MGFQPYFHRNFGYKGWLYILLSIFISYFTASCGASEKPKSLFTLLDKKETNIDFSNNITDTEEFNIVEYLNYYNGSGVAAGDINNDGLSDLYFAANQEPNRLYLNKGNFEFKDITRKAGADCPGGWKTGVSMADVNGDGWLDIYVCQVGDYKSVQGENHLYINNGDLTFTDRTEEYGLKFIGFSTQSLFFDYDNDGDLDMFLLNHAIHTPGSYGEAGIIRYSRDPKTGDKLFRNDDRDGHTYFTNVTEMAGIFGSRIGYGLGVSAGDVNNDGFVDLYISNDFHENDYLYINNGNGGFTETIRIAMGHTTKSSMGNDMADFNNDGLLDIFSLDMYPEDPVILKKSAGEEMMEIYNMKEELGYHYQLTRNALQLNRGKGVFSEIAAYAGVYATDWSWSPLFFDADNDGLKDLFISNGIPRRPNDLDYLQFVEDNSASINTNGPDRISSLSLVSMMPSDTISNYAYKNNGDLTFTNYTAEWGLTQRAFSNGCTYADLDNDGDLDLIVANLNADCFVYRNNSNELTDNHFLKVRFSGPEKNRFGVGVRVEVKAGGKLFVQQSIPARGAMSCVEQSLTFGLGNSSIIDTINVFWPGGTMEQQLNVQSDQVLTFDVKDAKRPNFKIADVPNPLFSDVTEIMGVDFRHVESNFSDFDFLPLLPQKLSREGPCVASADVNGDQLADIYIGGAAGQPGALFLQKGNGEFVKSEQSDFLKQADGEEVGATFLDADNDGDEDLYIARGSTEFVTKNGLNTDLFYRNNGRGILVPDNQAIPRKNIISTCVSSADFDNDGDMDIFLAGYSGINAYGLPSDCFIFRNDGKGKFTDIGDLGIHPGGMVKDALWTDLVKDGREDLVIVGHWMNVSIFKNSEDGFEDITSISGLDNSIGWWNTITAGDLDDDGDVDFVAGNLGENSKIKAAPGKPTSLYLSDFDSDGRIDPIICTYIGEQEYIFPTRDQLLKQVPFIRNRYPTYKSFAEAASINKIFINSQLENTHIVRANEFRTCIIENQGNGTFTIKPLPGVSQLFPVNSILVYDADQDGKKDIILGGNNLNAHIEYGRYDAGYGLVLKNAGNLEFNPLNFRQSGLMVRGEVRKMMIVETASAPLVFIGKNNTRWQVLAIGGGK